MNVLFTISYYHPYISGLTIAASRFAQGLAHAGINVTVLSMQHDISLPRHERICGVEVMRAPWIFKISKGFISLSWIIMSWRLVREHDVVVVNLPQFEGIIPALFARLTGKKLVSIYHCEVLLPKGPAREIVQSLLEVSHMGTLVLAHRVVTYTSDYAKKSRLLRYVRAKLTCIIPPIPMPKSHASYTQTLKRKLRKGNPIIGVSARLSQEKGIEYLIHAIPLLIKQFPTLKIVVAGPMDPVGETTYKARIVALTKKYARRIQFLGSVSPEEIGSFYKLLDVLVLPSINSTEAFGMVQVEAMLCGIPVVASNLPGVRVPIQKTGMGVLVAPRDVRGIADAIVKVVNNKQQYVKDVHEIRMMFRPETSMRAFGEVLV